MPLKVALSGIDRCCARLEARGPRRRPVRIEFCEADVLEAFDSWRRAIGVTATAAGEGAEAPPARKPALAAHIERVIARLANARGGGPAATVLHRQLEQAIRDLEQIAGSAVRVRGESGVIIAELSRMDDELMTAAFAQLEEDRARQLRAEAAEELAAFGNRLPPDVRTKAIESAFARLDSESAGLPTIRYD